MLHLYFFVNYTNYFILTSSAFHIVVVCTTVTVKAFYLLLLIVSYKFSIYHQPKPLGCRTLVDTLYSFFRGSVSMRYTARSNLILLVRSMLTCISIIFLFFFLNILSYSCKVIRIIFVNIL